MLVKKHHLNTDPTLSHALSQHMGLEHTPWGSPAPSIQARNSWQRIIASNHCPNDRVAELFREQLSSLPLLPHAHLASH